MKKKINFLIVVLMVIMLLVGCSGTNSENDVQANNDTQQKNELVEQDSNEEAQPEEQDSQDSNEEAQPEEQNSNDECDNQDTNQENDEVATDDSNETDEDPYKYSLDTEYSIDLNEDGQADTIFYSNNEEVVSITVNSKSFELDVQDPYLIYNKFRLVDIETSDKSIEIVTKEADPPLGSHLTFYRYDGENLYSFGCVSIGFSEEEQKEIIVDGNGEILVFNSSNIMRDGIYYKKYIVGETGNLEEVLPEDIYTYTSPITSKVNKEIKGYNNKNVEESYNDISPEEEIVIYGEIDNWLKIKWNDEEYWINDDELTHFGPDDTFEFEGIQFQS